MSELISVDACDHLKSLKPPFYGATYLVNLYQNLLKMLSSDTLCENFPNEKKLQKVPFSSQQSLA